MIILFIYLCFTVWLAWDNAKRKAADKHIYHGLNGSLHILAAVILLPDWMASVALLLLIKVVFDTSMNLFSKLPIDYISSEVRLIKSLWSALVKGKFTDYIEYKIFGNNGYTPKIIYLIIAVCLLIVR